MMKVTFITLLVVFTFLVIAPSEKSGLFAHAEDVKYEPVGCYRDTTKNPRPLPVLVKNFRWPHPLDWNNLNGTIQACAEKVKEAGYVYFGLQFYGECWSGPRAHLTYAEDGKSEHCILGVGKSNANFVYRLVLKEKVPPECSDYKVLDAADRSVNHRYTPKAECDYNLQPGWYRFQGDAGNTMANECPSPLRCGTIAPGWLKGELPSIKDGIVSRQACFHQNRNCCYKSAMTQVRKCNGFYVYKLPPAPSCQLRYCGSGKQE